MKHFQFGSTQESLKEELNKIKVKYEQWNSNDIFLHKELPNWREIISDFEKIFEAYDEIIELNQEDYELGIHYMREAYTDRM